MQTSQDFAEKFIEKNAVPKGAQLPLLVYHAGAWFEHKATTGWRETKKNQVQASVKKFLWRVLGERNLTERLTGDVLACVQAALTLPDGGDGVPQMFLTFENGDMIAEPADGWIATRTHLVNVELGMSNEELETDSEIPRCKNGAGLFTRGMVPCAYDPAAECPRWEQFVCEACPDDAEMLQMMFGLSLTYNRRFNVFFVVHGEAGTGKSTALDVLAALNAGVVCGVPLSAFGERFQTYPLTEHRLNLVQDMESIFEGAGSVSLREAVLKSCTAGEKLHVEQKHQGAEYRRMTALPVFGGNTLPRFADRSRAIADRMRIITFPRVFRGKKRQDLQLADKLRAELPGILNWAIAGYQMLVADGARTFPETKNAKLLKADLIKSARPEELFCDEMLERDADAVESSDKIYQAYREFCQRNGNKPAASNQVIPKICTYTGAEKSSRMVDGKRLRCLVGVRLIPEILVKCER